MSRAFRKFITEIIAKRVTETQNSMAENNVKYRECTRSIIQILDKLYKELPPEYQEMLEELEDIRSKRDSIGGRLLYRQGLSDGVRFGNIYDELRKMRP